MLARVVEIDVVNRGDRADAGEIDWLLAEVPLRVGGLIDGAVLESFLEGAAARLGTRVDAAIEAATDDPYGVRVVLVVGESPFDPP